MRQDNIIAGAWRRTTTPRVRTVKWKKASSDFDFWSRCQVDDYLRAQGATIFPDYDQWTDRETWLVLWPTSNVAKLCEAYGGITPVVYRVNANPPKIAGPYRGCIPMGAPMGGRNG